MKWWQKTFKIHSVDFSYVDLQRQYTLMYFLQVHMIMFTTYFYVYFFQKYNYEKNLSIYVIFLPILSLLFTTSFLSEGVWKFLSYFQAIAKLHLGPCQISIIFLKIVKYKRLFDRVLNLPSNSCRLTSSFLLFEKLCNIKNEWITPGNSSNLIFRRE